MMGCVVEGAEEKAAAELRQLKQQFDLKRITAEVYEERRRPLLAVMLSGHGGVAEGPDRNKGAMPDAARDHADGFDLSGAEKAVRHEYDPHARAWSRSAFLCIIEPEPFAEGAMRRAHMLTDMAAMGPDARLVAKFSKDPQESPKRFFDDVEMQTEARLWAQKFNALGPPKPIDFIAAYVLELVDRPGGPLCGVETFIPGTYSKWNNNWDWSDELRNTPAAFSHFTWEASGHKLLVCDLQGVGDLLTDPQIHTVDRQRYGKGNLGMEGIQKFLAAHRCNALCNFLALPPTPSSGRHRHRPRGAHASSGPQRTLVAPVSERRVDSGQSAMSHGKGLVGVGIALKSVGPELVVSHVVPQGAAFKNGKIMAGDRLLAVDGRPAGSVFEEVKGLILGAPDTTVTMTFKRGGVSFEATLVRTLTHLPQGQRLVDSQTQRSSRTREPASSDPPARGAPGPGARKSLRRSLMQGALSVLGFSAQKNGGLQTRRHESSPQDAGYNDPDVVRVGAAAALSPQNRGEVASASGWDDPDLVVRGPGADGRKSRNGGITALQEQWVLLDDEGAESSARQVSRDHSSGGWGELVRAHAAEDQLDALVRCLLRHVQWWDGTAELMRLGGVCRRWRAAVSDASLWTRIRCGDDCVLDDAALSLVCARAQGALTVLDIATSPQAALELRGQISLYTLVRCVQLNPALQEVHVSGCRKHVEYELGEFGLVLQGLEQLQALSLEACGLTGRGVQRLLSLFACSTSLTSLSLAHNADLGGDGGGGQDGVVALCAGLRINSTLTSLDLRGCRLTRKAAENLAEVLLMSPSLTDLQIDGVEQGAATVQPDVHRHSANLHALQSLLLGTGVRDGGFVKAQDLSQRCAAPVPEQAPPPPHALTTVPDPQAGSESAPLVQMTDDHGGKQASGRRLVMDAAADEHAGDAGEQWRRQVLRSGTQEGGLAGTGCGAEGQGPENIVLAVAPKWPRHASCQTKSSWREAQGVREQHRRLAGAAQRVLQEAQEALRGMTNERARMMADTEHLMKRIAALEGEEQQGKMERARLNEMTQSAREEAAKLKARVATLEAAAAVANAEVATHATACRELEQRVEAAEQGERQAVVAREALEARLEALMEEMAATQHALAASEERLIKGTLDARRHEPTASIDHAAGGDEVWFPGCEAAGNDQGAAESGKTASEWVEEDANQKGGVGCELVTESENEIRGGAEGPAAGMKTAQDAEVGGGSVGARVSHIERVHQALDPRTHEIVKTLILKGRTDQQVVKHYTIADTVSEAQVRAVRNTLALEAPLRAPSADTRAAHASGKSAGRLVMAQTPARQNVGPAGPGIEVSCHRPYVVAAMVPGGPAARSGQIAVGDELVSVQGQEVGLKSPDEIQSLLSGSVGSVVGLRLVRAGPRRDAYGVMLERAALLPVHPPGHTAAANAALARVRQDGVAQGADSSAQGASQVNAPPAGLGFTFQRDPSQRFWVVRRLKDGGFAQTSGLIVPGDVLLGVDDRAVSDITNPEEVAMLIAGDAGSSCMLDLMNPLTSQVRKIKGVRGRSGAPGGWAAHSGAASVRANV